MKSAMPNTIAANRLLAEKIEYGLSELGRLADAERRLVDRGAVEAFGGVEFEHAVRAQDIDRAYLRDHVGRDGDDDLVRGQGGILAVAGTVERAFAGTVEDELGPLELGRNKPRIYPIHSPQPANR